MDVNDRRIMAMNGDKDVKFADVLHGDPGMTIMVLLGAGPKSCLRVLFIIFQKRSLLLSK